MADNFDANTSNIPLITQIDDSDDEKGTPVPTPPFIIDIPAIRAAYDSGEITDPSPPDDGTVSDVEGPIDTVDRSTFACT